MRKYIREEVALILSMLSLIIGIFTNYMFFVLFSIAGFSAVLIALFVRHDLDKAFKRFE